MTNAISSIGVEIEFTDVPQDDVINFLHRSKIEGANVTTDASCTKHRLAIGNFPVTREQLTGNLSDWARQVFVGGEFISPIIYTNRNDKKWFEPLNDTINFLTDQGEKPSLVSGIHVHMNVGGYKGINVEFLRTIVNIWRKVEAAMYRITAGEMETSRGAEQLSYCYYRPLVPKNGPAVIQDSMSRVTPCFELDKLLLAEDVQEFFQALGRSDCARGNRWATKYHALNFCSVGSKGTIELRTPNFTNNPKFLYAWIRVFQMIGALGYAAYAKPVDVSSFSDLPLGYNGDDFGLEQFLQIVPIQESEVIYTLEEIWNLTKWNKPVEGYQWSHLGHGLGRNMQATVVEWRNVRKELIPEKISTSVKIHHPDEFAKDKSVTSLGNDEAEPQIRRRERPRDLGTTELTWQVAPTIDTLLRRAERVEVATNVPDDPS